MSRRVVPDLFPTLYANAREAGLDDAAAAWHAEELLHQLADLPQLPKEPEGES